MNYLKYLKKINEVAKKGDLVYFYNDSGSKVQGRVLSVNGNIYTIDYNGNTYQTNDILYEASSNMGTIDKYLICEDDSTDIKKALGEIKDKVTKIVAAIRDGHMGAAAKAVVEYTDTYGAPFTQELQTQMLVIKDKAFLDSWKEELAKQSAIYKELHPTTPPKPKAKPKHKDSKPPEKPKPPAHVGSKKPVGPEGSH